MLIQQSLAITVILDAALYQQVHVASVGLVLNRMQDGQSYKLVAYRFNLVRKMRLIG